jgi:hypothetical protein
MSNEFAFALGIAVGVMVGMMYEHQRFLKEIQSLSKQHGEPA